jgi:hypothetical protein
MRSFNPDAAYSSDGNSAQATQATGDTGDLQVGLVGFHRLNGV